MQDSTKRFSNRVDNYVRYRPNYPGAIIPFLKSAAGLSPSKVVADIGAGTGIATVLFLKNGNRVFAVEPNDAMRMEAEKSFGAFPQFVSVKGTAERTGLVNQSVDMIIAAQAFHWFDAETTRKEFKRIMKKDGYVVLIWNERRTDTPFLGAYEMLLKQYATDYGRVDHRNITPEKIAEFFAPSHFDEKVFENDQVFGFEGLKGRLLSSSYIPAEGHPQFPSMIMDLKNLFDTYAANDEVIILYKTILYYGHL
jgi:ubiquinone/menaquinone biosynthesis C-methylase UbiE